MKTIITQQIDGYDIIVKTDDANKLIDQEATKIIINQEIQKTDIHKNIEQIKQQMQNYAMQALQAKRNSMQAKNKSDKVRFYDEFKLRHNQVMELSKNELNPMIKELNQRYMEMMFEFAVFSVPAPYETIVTDEFGASADIALVEATQEGKVVDKDLNRIADNRGRVFWKKIGSDWTKSEMTKLGDVPPAQAIEEKDLSAEQITEIQTQTEEKRISAMTSQQRAMELAIVINGLKQQAVNMRSTLEIEGNLNALVLAQEWLAVETEKAEIKYA
jgi:hypothetical protein